MMAKGIDTYAWNSDTFRPWFRKDSEREKGGQKEGVLGHL